jgi:hypothetical protein
MTYMTYTDRPTDRLATGWRPTDRMQNAPGARPPGQGRAAMGHGNGAFADNFFALKFIF